MCIMYVYMNVYMEYRYYGWESDFALDLVLS